MTEGISMEPSIHAGALVLVRPAPSYRVGDVVLYNSSVVRRPVLHRILLIQGGNYFFQGDNNDFVDPGYATPSQLMGKLWVRIPRIGAWLGWVGHPRNAALLAGLAALGIGLTAVPTKRRRRRSTELSAILASTRTLPTVNDSTSRPTGDAPLGARASKSAVTLSGSQPPAFLDGPLPTLVGFVISLLLAGLLLGIGFALPTQRTVSRPDAYRQSGTFSYQAKPRTSTPVYPTGVVKTGDPIYPSLVDVVTLTFRYRFTSALPHSVKGTISMREVLQSQDGTWQTLSTLTSGASFSGDRATVTAQITLRDLYALLDKVSAQTGAESVAYSADLEPVIHLTGRVGDSAIASEFSPTLPIEIDRSAITLKVTTGAPPPGATYIPPSREEELSSTLTPVIAGTLPTPGPNVVTIAHYHPTVAALRSSGIAFGALALVLIAVHDLWRRRMNRKSEEEVLTRRLGIPLVPVEELPKLASPSVGVPGFSHLAELARYLERPVLYVVHNDSPTFAVDDGLRSYRFTKGPSQSGELAPQEDELIVEQQADVPAVAEAQPSGRPRRHSFGKGALGCLVVIVVIVGGVTLVTSYTATTAVPTSHIGTSVEPRLVSQLAPQGCSSLAVTTLEHGSGSFSNSLSHALILGSAGNDTITDTGVSNCVVAGGGTNTVNGPSTDICISGPTNNIANQCGVHSNGVTAAHSADNYSNYGGQERIALTNVSSITALTITIKVAQTTGVAFSSQETSFPGGAVADSESTSGGFITYVFTLNAGQTIPANFAGGTAYAQFSGTGAAHAMSGDTWTVTSTSGGITSTLTGTF